MTTLRSPFFIICLLLFIIHQVMQKGMNIHYKWFDRYLDNLLAMPVILTLLQAERIFLFRKGSAYRLTFFEIVMATLYIVLITEIIFPVFSKDFTRDWADTFFYFAGSLLFCIINKTDKLQV